MRCLKFLRLLRLFISRKSLTFALSICIGFLWIFSGHSAEHNRYDNLVYVSDYLSQPVKLKTLRATPLTVSRDGSGLLDTLLNGQQVTLVGLGQEATRYLVSARVTNGHAEG